MAVPRRARVRDWLYDVAEATARAARRALRTPASAARTVRQGASGSPTSALDAIAERAILARLDDAPVPVNLLSEEIGVVERGADWWLVADPVDGTRNALRGIPFYAVSLALGRKDLSGMEMGLVQSIPTGDDYWAERGRGATLNGRRLRPRRFDPREVLLGTALDDERGLRLPGDASLHFRDLGSAALEMCFVAQGVFDGFLCTQPIVRVIDVAASTLVVREAGGHVYDLEKKRLNVGFDLRRRFPMVVVGRDSLWRKLR